MFRDDSKDSGIITAKGLVDFGLKCRIPLDSIAHELESRRSQNKNTNGAIVAVSDSRVQRILATLNAKLGISLDLRDLPPVPANPDPGKFTNLVLVLAKTTVGKLVKAQNITPYINLAKVINADGIKTPKGDYWLWMQGGLLYKGKCVNDVTKLFAKNERGGTCKEGLFLYLYYPELINVCLMNFVGSRYVHGFVPCLDCWDGGLELGTSYLGVAYYDTGSVSAGVVS